MPKLQAGWENSPHSLAQEHSFIDERIKGKFVGYLPQKRVSHNFRYIRFPINVVEAKVKGSTKGTRLSLVRLKDF